MKGEPNWCTNCAEEPSIAKGRCEPCYRYHRKHGRERPERCAELEANVADGLFSPPRGHRGVLAAAEARRLCGRCPVRAECLEAALSNDEEFGVWGGVSAEERRQLRKLRSAEVS